MNGLEKIVDYIRADAAKECEEIAACATEECKQIKADYTKREQGEYWNAINKGTKAAELRLQSLGSLAETEAKKQISSMQQEMADVAFEHAAQMFRDLSEEDYSILLRKVQAEDTATPEDLVSRHKESLNKLVISTLFD